MRTAENDPDTPGNPATQATDPHLKMQRILVPIDFTPAALHALRSSALMAEKMGGTVCLLHVVDCGAIYNELDKKALTEANAEIIQEAQQQLEDLATAELGQTPHSKAVRVGNPGREIIETAKSENSDLIIMAIHEHQGLQRVFHRDTCRQVELEAPCHVLTLHCDDAGEIEPKLWKGTATSRIGEWVGKVFLNAFGTPNA